MAKFLCLYFLAMSFNVYGQLSCEFFQGEADFWRQEYHALRANVQQQEREEEIDDSGYSEEPESIEVSSPKQEIQEIEIGYFYYDNQGDYLYQRLR